MNKNIKMVIASALIMGVFSTSSALFLNPSLDITAKPVYASSKSDGELKSLKIKSLSGSTLSLRDGYNGDTVKLGDDKEYYVKMTDDSDGIKIDADPEDSDYIVRIFTSDKENATPIKPGEEISLGKGDTTLYVRTYESLGALREAKDVKKDVRISEDEYTINVRKTTGSSNEDTVQDSIYLDKIQLSRGSISFLKQVTSYDINVDDSTEEIKITAPPESENNRVRIDGSVVESSNNYKKTVSLNKGKNEIKIKVTDDNDNQRTYTLNITRGNSDNQDNIYLNNLTLSQGKINFSSDDTSYDVDLDESINNITIGAEPENDGYLVTIDGKKVNSNDEYKRKVSLNKGKNEIKVEIKDEVNNKKRAYTLNINIGKAEDTNKTDTTTNENTNQTSDKKTGWVTSSEGLRYYNENGEMLKASWFLDKSTNVYYYLNENGLRATGWFKDNNNWYLLNKEGAMLTGWQYAGGQWYMLDKTSGAMKTGWYKEEAAVQNNTDAANTANSASANVTTYYLNEDGSMRTGWFIDKGKWYFFNNNGQMQKGWVVYSNSKYYLNEDGTMTTGTKTIDGKSYKFTESGVLVI